MDKKALSERDIITKYVLDAIQRAGWKLKDQVYEEYALTKDRVSAKGPHGPVRVPGTAKRADIVLFYKDGLPLAVIEAKDNNHALGAGMRQALDYAALLDVPLAYSTNGDAFLENDRTGTSKRVEREIPLDRFPAPAELWRRYCAYRGLGPAEEAIAAQSWHSGMEDKPPRYYQIRAVNAVVEAIARGQDRILLVMATGTGKTFTAFQIIWRLWKAKAKKRVLFLADRNILIDQAKRNDFQPFGQALTKIVNRKADASYEIYLALYQAVSGTEEEKNIYKQFSPGFFDLVIVDECHRGSAAADSAWREILEYFSSATQIGMTATPKVAGEDVAMEDSNITYFGDPIFTYSLRQGIEDGYLAPYTVIRVELDKDLTGYKPEKGKRDKYGQPVPVRNYKRPDFDRTMVLDPRTQLVARRVTEYLKGHDRFAKTIVFCVDIEHAQRMRSALVQENADLCQENPRYVVSITADDSTELDDFMRPSERYPVIATTSKLLSTGVDAQTVKLIVIDQEIGSMAEFKQIIGRGTRIREDHDKLAFTIMDFRGATKHFQDEKFDGPPEQTLEIKGGDAIAPPDEPAPPSPRATTATGKSRDKIHLDDVDVTVVRETTERYGADGKRIDVPIADHARAVVRALVKDRADLRRRWLAPEDRADLLRELLRQGVSPGDLAGLHGAGHATLDLLAHTAFGAPLLLRRERARSAAVRKLLATQKDLPRRVLDALLAAFADGHEDLDDTERLRMPPFSEMGTPLELVRAFGGRAGFDRAIAALEAALYAEA